MDQGFPIPTNGLAPFGRLGLPGALGEYIVWNHPGRDKPLQLSG